MSSQMHGGHLLKGRTTRTPRGRVPPAVSHRFWWSKEHAAPPLLKTKGGGQIQNLNRGAPTIIKEKNSPAEVSQKCRGGRFAVKATLSEDAFATRAREGLEKAPSLENNDGPNHPSPTTEIGEKVIVGEKNRIRGSGEGLLFVKVGEDLLVLAWGTIRLVC